MYILCDRTHISPQTVTQVVGGSIAGIMEFRQGALTSLRDELDTLAQVFVGEVNDVHALGINAHYLGQHVPSPSD